MSQIFLTPKRAFAVTATLGLLSLFPPLATDMYLAALGELAASMNATHTAAELSLSIFFLGLCFGQILIGPLTDTYGRKRPLLVGTVLFTVTSIALPLMNDIAWFNALRFLQAIGASAGMVVGRAMVKDLYEGQKAAKVMTVLVMLLTLGPIASPTMGSLLLEAFGWQSIFATMALISLVALTLSVVTLPETLPAQDRQPAPIRNGLKAAKRLLSQRGFVTMALVAGLIPSGMFAFITGSSGVFQGIFGLSSIGFGIMFAIIATALIIFGRINGILLNRFIPEQILKTVLPLFAASTILLTLLSQTDSLLVFVVPLWVSIGLVGLLSANAISLAMETTKAAAGVGSALLGAIQFALAFAVSSFVAIGGASTALPMALGLAIPASAASLLYFVTRRSSESENSNVEL
ncbi:MFS transporter, DHA1 family, bicyclomycin/chloramphenicol resistance protein [Sulfitobacter marinus]|uniref:Bcr/CflA family efflux transporter n=1 Tax=Sulfitobacter marinus TaxID=394264 RepID=A0A1I6UX16_9RHOB|nr:multidrug effflux MFS transporter [Sulfitobacter marinus]SFT05953.1 MFS transporter, DHA1 family, bicyclomycin/chloramphenicol resistance protein [Sulfitobacter marinus]